MTDLLAEMVRQKTVNVVSEKLTEHPYLEERGEEYRVADIVKREFKNGTFRFRFMHEMRNGQMSLAILAQVKVARYCLCPVIWMLYLQGKDGIQIPLNQWLKMAKCMAGAHWITKVH